jgi:hypothetical protein
VNEQEDTVERSRARPACRDCLPNQRSGVEPAKYKRASSTAVARTSGGTQTWHTRWKHHRSPLMCQRGDERCALPLRSQHSFSLSLSIQVSERRLFYGGMRASFTGRCC